MMILQNIQIDDKNKAASFFENMETTFQSFHGRMVNLLSPLEENWICELLTRIATLFASIIVYSAWAVIKLVETAINVIQVNCCSKKKFTYKETPFKSVQVRGDPNSFEYACRLLNLTIDEAKEQKKVDAQFEHAKYLLSLNMDKAYRANLSIIIEELNLLISDIEIAHKTILSNNK